MLLLSSDSKPNKHMKRGTSVTIALTAHDKKKELMIQFCTAYQGILSKHSLCATGTTGQLLADSIGLNINRFLPGIQGGIEQISARVAYNEVDIVMMFRDALNGVSYEDEQELIRLCDAHNIPLATNIATAEALIHALERGDLQWRENIRDEGELRL